MAGEIVGCCQLRSLSCCCGNAIERIQQRMEIITYTFVPCPREIVMVVIDSKSQPECESVGRNAE